MIDLLQKNQQTEILKIALNRVLIASFLFDYKDLFA